MNYRNLPSKELIEKYFTFESLSQSEKELFKIAVRERIEKYGSLTFRNKYVKSYETSLKQIWEKLKIKKRIPKSKIRKTITVCDACGEHPPVENTIYCQNCISYSPEFNY